jgi:hypothetical protein
MGWDGMGGGVKRSGVETCRGLKDVRFEGDGRIGDEDVLRSLNDKRPSGHGGLRPKDEGATGWRCERGGSGPGNGGSAGHRAILPPSATDKRCPRLNPTGRPTTHTQIHCHISSHSHSLATPPAPCPHPFLSPTRPCPFLARPAHPAAPPIAAPTTHPTPHYPTLPHPTPLPATHPDVAPLLPDSPPPTLFRNHRPSIQGRSLPQIRPPLPTTLSKSRLDPPQCIHGPLSPPESIQTFRKAESFRPSECTRTP